MPRNVFRDEEFANGELEGALQLVRDFKDECDFYDVDPEAAFAQLLDHINKETV